MVDGYSTPYDGNSHGLSGTATGVVGADLSAYLTYGAAITNVAESGPISWSFDAGSNYNTTSGSATVTITALHITGSFTAADKTYDGNTSATVTGTALSGTVAGDDVTLGVSSANFASANPGTRTVTGTYFLSGTDAGNYILDSVAATKGIAPIAAILHAKGSHLPIIRLSCRDFDF